MLPNRTVVPVAQAPIDDVAHVVFRCGPCRQDYRRRAETLRSLFAETIELWARKRNRADIPPTGQATAEEFAKVHLASEEADYVSGQTFTIDGGLMMNLGQGA